MTMPLLSWTRVGSCGVNAGSGGACTLFQGTGCCAEATVARNKQHANAVANHVPPLRVRPPRNCGAEQPWDRAAIPIRVILSGAPALLSRLALFASRAGA